MKTKQLYKIVHTTESDEGVTTTLVYDEIKSINKALEMLRALFLMDTEEGMICYSDDLMLEYSLSYYYRIHGIKHTLAIKKSSHVFQSSKSSRRETENSDFDYDCEGCI